MLCEFQPDALDDATLTPEDFYMKNSLQSLKPDLAHENLMVRLMRWLDQVPYTLLGILLRIAVATVFWNSAMTELANWNTAVELFREEYKVPILPPGNCRLYGGFDRVDRARAAGAWMGNAARGAGTSRHDGGH